MGAPVDNGKFGPAELDGLTCALKMSRSNCSVTLPHTSCTPPSAVDSSRPGCGPGTAMPFGSRTAPAALTRPRRTLVVLVPQLTRNRVPSHATSGGLTGLLVPEMFLPFPSSFTPAVL